MAPSLCSSRAARTSCTVATHCAYHALHPRFLMKHLLNLLGATAPPCELAMAGQPFVLAETNQSDPRVIAFNSRMLGLVWNQCGRPHLTCCIAADPPTSQILVGYFCLIFLSYLWFLSDHYKVQARLRIVALFVPSSIDRDRGCNIRPVFFLFLHGTIVGSTELGATGSEGNCFGTKLTLGTGIILDSPFVMIGAVT
jgi:hypothetical protein